MLARKMLRLGDPRSAYAVAAGHGIALGWEGALPEPVLTGSSATYPDVRPGTDLVVKATRAGFEEFVVAKDRAALDAALAGRPAEVGHGAEPAADRHHQPGRLPVGQQPGGVRPGRGSAVEVGPQVHRPGQPPAGLGHPVGEVA